MGQDLGHGHGGHGVGAPAHDEHPHDDHEHGAHGHHPSAMTRELSGKLGVFAGAVIALLAIVLNATVGPLFGGGSHHGEGAEEREWPTALPGEADVLLVNGHVRQPGFKEASVIAVRNGKIIGVGEDELLARRTATTMVHDLHGGYVIPGLRDAHGHLGELGAKLNQRICDLSETNDSLEDVVRAFETWVKVNKRDLKPGEPLEGHGWDESKWKSYTQPSAEELEKAIKAGHNFEGDENKGFKAVPASLPDSTELLDQIAPDNPVVLRRVDGHMAWVNHKALDLAKITKDTFNPPGGRILRDKNNEPTGVLVDTAIELVAAALPKKPDDERIREAEEDLVAAAQACAMAGLVEVHDASVGMTEELALRHLAKSGRLPIRVYAMVSGGQQELAERLSRPGPMKEALGDRLTIRAVKLFADGAMGSHGALLQKPYADDPAATGLRTLSKDEIATVAALCLKNGWQLCIHAIGDQANRDVLDVYEKVLGNQRGLRWRVEHAQLVDKADWGRFAKLGVIASMQPTHATSDMRWAEQRLGKDRLEGAYAWRSLLEAGAHLAFGSDFPVESERPALGLYAAVTRQDKDGKPDGGWLPKERLTPEQALAAFTEGPAYASFAEDRRGRIAIGMDADFTVFSEDPLELLASSPKKLLEAQVVGTFVGGKSALR